MVWHTSDDYWDCRGSTLFLWAPHWPKSSQAKKPYPIKATDTGICIEKQKEHFKSQKRQWKKQCNIWTALYWSDVSVFAQCELWRGPDKLQLWHPVPSDNDEHPPHQTGFYLSYSASNITTMTTYRHRLATTSTSPSSPPWSSSASPGSPSSSLLSRFLAEFPWEWQRYSQWLPCLEASGKTCQGIGPKLEYVIELLLYILFVNMKPPKFDVD